MKGVGSSELMGVSESKDKIVGMSQKRRDELEKIAKKEIFGWITTGVGVVGVVAGLVGGAGLLAVFGLGVAVMGARGLNKSGRASDMLENDDDLKEKHAKRKKQQPKAAL